ncbi:MAG: hypothetical protein LBU79_00745 [Planctomycetota bacterium]|jgi:tetratricopeptide (TPR) repeat protein|nr:hypothetical protein [Planctomycetota bacterium]
MIGEFNLEPPPLDDNLLQMVESHRAKTGQDYAAILFFGLWGTVDCSPEVRLYAGYRHLADHASDGPAWLEVSRTQLEAGKGEEAERILDELLRLDCPGLYPNLYSEDPEVHRAYIRAEGGEREEALELLANLAAKHGDSPVYQFFVASLLHQAGDFAGAVERYRNALSALEEFQREAENEDFDSGIDFAMARQYIDQYLQAAEAGQILDSDAPPLDLFGFITTQED